MKRLDQTIDKIYVRNRDQFSAIASLEVSDTHAKSVQLIARVVPIIVLGWMSEDRASETADRLSRCSNVALHQLHRSGILRDNSIGAQ